MCAAPESEVNYCLRCGSRLVTSWRFGAQRPACPACEWVFFPDPKVAAAVLVEQDGEVLLARRVTDPQRGLWTLPAGFVDAGEDPADAARRECLEETGLEVHITRLIDVLAGREHPRGADIFIVYQAEIVGGKLQAGDDVDRAGFYPRSNLPPLAFNTTRKILGSNL